MLLRCSDHINLVWDLSKPWTLVVLKQQFRQVWYLHVCTSNQYPYRISSLIYSFIVQYHSISFLYSLPPPLEEEQPTEEAQQALFTHAFLIILWRNTLYAWKPHKIASINHSWVLGIVIELFRFLDWLIESPFASLPYRRYWMAAPRWMPSYLYIEKKMLPRYFTRSCVSTVDWEAKEEKTVTPP